MFRFFRRLLLIFILVGVGLVLGRNVIGNWIGTEWFRRATGFTTFIGVLDIKLTRPEIILRDVAIRNPLDVFREPRWVEINRLEVVYQPISILQGAPHFRRITMEISEVVVVKNAAGEINLKRFQGNSKQKKNGGEFETVRKLQIDELVLSVGKVLYLDENQATTPPKVFTINAHKRVFKNVKDFNEVQKIIMNLVLGSLPANLLNLEPEAAETVKGVKETVKKKGEAILNMFRNKEPSEKK